MSAPAGSQIRLVIVGATGMVGGYALHYALDHPSIGTVTVIGRRKLGISHPKLKEVLHRDFTDCSALAKPLSDQDAAIFCLGVYTGAVPDAEFCGHFKTSQNWRRDQQDTAPTTRLRPHLS